MDEEDDVQILEVKNDSSISSMPHARYDCTVHPFDSAAESARHAQCCPNCFCFVCDVPSAECDSWPAKSYNYTLRWRPRLRAAFVPLQFEFMSTWHHLEWSYNSASKFINLNSQIIPSPQQPLPCLFASQAQFDEGSSTWELISSQFLGRQEGCPQGRSC